MVKCKKRQEKIMDKIIKNKVFGEERALYGLKDATVTECTFAGDEDGESALKECRRIEIKDCNFKLRYPIWHAEGLRVYSSLFEETARAPLWYSCDGYFKDTRIYPVKFLRQCENISFENCDIVSEEFGWKSKNITIKDSKIEGFYLFLDSEGVTLDGVEMKGKYSFQYMKNLTVKNSILDTKDAFWHSENVRVENCTVKGEYLGWFSKNLTLVNCRISGTQPLCYCEDLTLVNCTMEGCDLSFEYSSVNATVEGHIDSVKNVKSGKIICGSVGEIINEDPIMECSGEIVTE